MTDIQTIIKGVLNLSPHYYQTNRGDIEVSCILCKRFLFLKNAGMAFKMKDIDHASDCPYLAAERLNKEGE